MKEFKGFTLAEVFITLGIIGIVAAMTLPTAIQNHRKKVIINQLKKSYSELSQAINMSVNENGDTDSWALTNPLNTVQGNIEYTDKYIAPYLKVVKKAGGVAGWWTCTPNRQFPGLYCVSTTSKKYNYGGWIPYILYLQNGSTLTVRGTGNRIITVDVNGIKGPNIAGHDVYTFAISKNKLSPAVGDYTWSCSATSTDGYNGWGCSAKIIKNNWKFPDDYPIKF